MTRLRERSPKEARLVALAPHGHWRTSTFLADLRHYRLTAPAVFDDAINGELFIAYVEQLLAPTLLPGDIVVLDNLSSDKVHGVRELVEARDANLMLLPPYSPDLNLLEQVVTKVKQLVRRTTPRSRDALWNRIRAIATQFAASAGANYVANSGRRRSE